MCEPIHTRSMWMVERHLKFLKALFTQRARLEGSMVDGYMVYQTMVYIIEYLLGLAFIKIILDWRIGDPNSINKFEGEYWSTWWGKLDRGRWKVIIRWCRLIIIHLTFGFYVYIVLNYFISNLQYESIIKVYCVK